MGVYTPLRERRLALAVLASGFVGAIVDSAVFLLLAFGNLAYLEGLIVGKLWASLAAFGLLIALRRRGGDEEVSARLAAVGEAGGCATGIGAHVDALHAAVIPGPAQAVAHRAAVLLVAFARVGMDLIVVPAAGAIRREFAQLRAYGRKRLAASLALCLDLHHAAIAA